MTPKHPILDVASGPNPGMIIYGPGRTSEHQTGPTPILDKPNLEIFEDVAGLTSFKWF